MLADYGHRVVPQKWRPAGDHLVEHGSQGVEVGPRRYLAAHGLLRGHVRDGADHHALGGQPRPVDGYRQAEVANLGHPIAGEPDVAGFKVPVDDAPAVGELQTAAGFFGDVDGLLQRKAVVSGVFDDSFHVATTHQLGDHVGLIRFLTKVEHGDDVRMGAEAAHGLGLAGDAAAGDIVQALGLDQSEGYFPVQQGILGQVDSLFATFAQEALYLVAAVGEG